MTQEQKQIKLAEVAGWKVHPKDRFIVIPPNSPHSVQPLSTIPDYFNDLNAVHELEKMLLPDDAYYSQRNFYSSELGRMTGNDNSQGWKPLSNDACFNILHATAAQRAEALGKILKLW